MEREFTPMQEFYNTSSTEEILKKELKFYEEDPAFLLEFNDTEIKVEGTIIES